MDNCVKIISSLRSEDRFNKTAQNMFTEPCTHSSHRTKALWTEGLPFSNTVSSANRTDHYNNFHSSAPYQSLLLSPVHHQWQVSPSRLTAGGSEYSLGQMDEVGRRSPLSPHTPSPVETILVPYQQLKQKLNQLYNVLHSPSTVPSQYTYRNMYYIHPAPSPVSTRTVTCITFTQYHP
jgi:hypothetical protein